MAASAHPGQLTAHARGAASERVSHQAQRAPLTMQRSSITASRHLLSRSWVPAASALCAGGGAPLEPGHRSARVSSRGHALHSSSLCGSSRAGAAQVALDAAPQQHSAAVSRALEVKDGDVHVVWCYTDKVQKSFSLWQLFKERFLPHSELKELGMDDGVATQARQHKQQRAQHHQQQQQHCEGGESTWSHQDERLLARVLTRTSLASAINGLSSDGAPLQPRDVRFARNAHGKPFLEQPCVVATHPHTNSHTDSHSHSLEAPGSITAQQPATQQNGCALQEVHPEAVHAHAFKAKTQWTPELGQGAQGLPLLQFNTTHTSGVVGCAVAPGNIAVGLDVERLGRVPKGGKLMALARRRFAAAECAALEACQDEAQQARVFSYLWSLKEAALKARGTGISAPPGLRGFAIGLHPWQDRRADGGLCTLDFSGALQQLCPGLWGVPESQHIGSPTGTNSSSTQSTDSKSRSGTPLFHITMQPGSGLEQSEAQQPRYHFLLFHLGTQHVGALCLAVPPGLIWPPARTSAIESEAHPQARAASQTPLQGETDQAAVAAAASGQLTAAVHNNLIYQETPLLVRIHVWEGVPEPAGHAGQTDFALSAAPVRIEAATSDGGLGSEKCDVGHGRPVVLVGCTVK